MFGGFSLLTPPPLPSNSNSSVVLYTNSIHTVLSVHRDILPLSTSSSQRWMRSRLSRKCDTDSGVPIASSHYSIQLPVLYSRTSKIRFPIDCIHEAKFEIQSSVKILYCGRCLRKLARFLLSKFQTYSLPFAAFYFTIVLFFSEFIISRFHTSNGQGTILSHSMYGLSTSQFIFQRLEIRSLTELNLGITVQQHFGYRLQI